MSNSTSASNILPIMEEGNDIQQNSSFSFLQQSMAVPSLVLSTIGFVTNILVIIVILCGSLRHSIFMSLLVVLAITDNLTLLASNLVQPGVFGHLFGPAVTVCRIFSFLMLSCGTMSSWTVVLVSVERYIAIFYPLKVHLYTEKDSYSYVLFYTHNLHDQSILSTEVSYCHIQWYPCMFH